MDEMVIELTVIGFFAGLLSSFLCLIFVATVRMAGTTIQN